MNELEFEIIEELYFVTSFTALLTNLSTEKQELKEALTTMVKQEWVTQLQYNITSKEFEKNSILNLEQFEECSYLATKKGLLLHNGLNG